MGQTWDRPRRIGARLLYELRSTLHALTWMTLAITVTAGLLIFLFEDTPFLAAVSRPDREVTGPTTPLEGIALLFALVTLLLVAAGGMRPVYRGRHRR